MKKIAIAAAAAMSAAAAGAASVELYGIVDTGLDYTNKDALAGTTETFEILSLTVKNGEKPCPARVPACFSTVRKLL